MRKSFYIIIMMVGTLPIFAFDLDIDILSINPNAFVLDQSNKIQQGNVIKETTLLYYGEYISANISSEKNKPENMYIFYQSKNDSRSLLKEFMLDTISYYLDKAIYMHYDVVYTDSGEIEQHYNFCFSDGRAIILYSKIELDRGIRGFGVALKSNDANIVNGELGAIIASAINFKYGIFEITDSTTSSLKTNTIYIKPSLYTDNWAYSFKKDDISAYGYVIIKNLVQHSSEYEPYYYKFEVSVSLGSEALLMDSFLLSRQIKISDGYSISLYDVIKSDTPFIYYSSNRIIGIEISWWGGDELEKYDGLVSFSIKSIK